MKTTQPNLATVMPAALLALSTILYQPSTLCAQGTTFTYQGLLTESGSPVTGIYEFRFNLYATDTDLTKVTTGRTNYLVPVTNGLFMTKIDFGDVFHGDVRWLYIGSRTNGNPSDFIPLSPREELTPMPYAMFAANANSLGGQPATAFAPVSGSSAYVARSGDTMTDDLTVQGQVSGDGSFFRAGIYGTSGSLLANQGTGVWGENTAGGVGVKATSNFGIGVHASSTSGDGVYGEGKNGVHGFSATEKGVYGFSASGGASGAGVWGENPVFGGTAVVGKSLYPFPGVNGLPGGTGVYGESASATGTGVYGANTGGGEAGHFQGAVTVNGTLTTLALTVSGAGGEQAYLGGDGFGGDVQIGSLNPAIMSVACYNAANNSYMHLSCSSLTIEGGADLAEPFQITLTDNEILQGAVVVIDEENPGHLKMSDRPYDTRVAGVVSGANGINPGIQMQQQGLLEGGNNVALTGRVYVQAEASDGAIRPGDLLTSSSVPGHAMKAADHGKAQGAILGKAMSALKEGKGMVLVLVTLQ